MLHDIITVQVCGWQLLWWVHVCHVVLPANSQGCHHASASMPRCCLAGMPHTRHTACATHAARHAPVVHVAARQSLWRGYAARSLYQDMRRQQGALVIQSAWRRLAHQSAYAAARHAAEVLQSAWRCVAWVCGGTGHDGATRPQQVGTLGARRCSTVHLPGVLMCTCLAAHARFAVLPGASGRCLRCGSSRARRARPASCCRTSRSWRPRCVAAQPGLACLGAPVLSVGRRHASDMNMPGAAPEGTHQCAKQAH
jgi:hypothetical protein